MSQPQPIPPGIDFDMFASDLSLAISRYGYSEKGLDVDSRAIRDALPEFVTAILAAQARYDAQDALAS